MAKELTEYLSEALAKSRTEEGRRELLEESERLKAEARQVAQAAPPGGGRPPRDVQGAPVAPEPFEMHAVTRVDPILPDFRAVEVREHPAREAGRLAFGGVVEERELPHAQLPLLPAPEGPRVPVLELSDSRGVPTMARGRGAPLDLRLAIASCIMTPIALRKTEGRIVTTVRELRDFLYPNGWQRGRDWPRIREALYRAPSYSFPGPFRIPEGLAKRWVPFGLQVEPGENAELDDLVVIKVDFPPDSGAGPVINGPDLFQLGVVSGPKFRAYIAAHSVAWRPGITRRRHPRNRSVHLWSANPAHYPVLTAADRDRLAFGRVNRARKEGRRSADAHWEELPGVEILSRTATTQDGQKGWVIVPEAAAAAIRSRES